MMPFLAGCFLAGMASTAIFMAMIFGPERKGPRKDPVNHPAHYVAGGIEAIDVIEQFGLGFHLGNVVKYVLRSDRKGAPVEDLKKARWFLDREISRREARK